MPEEKCQPNIDFLGRRVYVGWTMRGIHEEEMKNSLLFRYLTLALAFATGCAGSNGENGVNGRNGRDGDDADQPMVRLLNASSRDCDGEGVVVAAGVDGDHNGKLDDDEIDESEVICSGVDGEDGEDGLDADPGIGGVVKSIRCNAGVPNTAVTFLYDAVEFEDGSVWASASIIDDGLVFSGSRFYAPHQPGGDLGTIQVAYDVQGYPNGGVWTMGSTRKTSPTVSIRYHDDDLPDTPQSWDMDGDGGGCEVVIVG